MADPKFKRGARRSPAFRIAQAERFMPVGLPPAQAAYVPSKLDMWGNDQYGDCVTAEEAFAKATYSPEIFIDPAIVIQWATSNGYRDGADLSSVLQTMQDNGFLVSQQRYNDGGPSTVDYSREGVLQAAISEGPVKIAIDANALPQGAGNQMGWSAIGGSPGQYGNTDHCVALCGYGRAGWLYSKLNVPIPSGVDPSASGYLLYTWATIGFVDHAWIMSTCAEAWLRSPTTIGVPPLSPEPTPTPTPTPPVPTPTPTPTPLPPFPWSAIEQVILAWLLSLLGKNKS